jgi:hypothetical protein
LCSKEWNFWVLLLFVFAEKEIFLFIHILPGLENTLKIVAQFATFCSFGIDFLFVSLYNDIEDKTKTDGGI